MRLLIYLLIGVFFVAVVGCRSANSSSRLTGNYYSKGRDYEYILEVNPDSTFRYRKYIQDARPSCDGSWKRINATKYLLVCDSVNDIQSLISNHYMNEQKLIIEVKKSHITVNGKHFKRRKRSPQ